MRPGRNGTVTPKPACLRRLLDRSPAAEHDEVGQRDALAGRLEVGLDALEHRQHRRELGRVVRRPVLLRRQAQASAVGAAALVGGAERRRRRPGGADQLLAGQAGVEQPLLELGDVGLADQLVVDRRHRVLPQLRLRDVRAEVARDRAHVAVQQLEPGAGVLVGEELRVLVVPLRDLLVDRVGDERDVGRRHHRPVEDALDVGVRDGRRRRVGRLPLLRPGGALGELPLPAEQRVEVAVVPLRRRGGPGALEAAGDRVLALAGAVLAAPAEAAAHVDRAALGLRADQRRVTGAVRLAERVATGDERDGLLVVHRHPAEGDADVVGGGAAGRDGPPGPRG